LSVAGTPDKRAAKECRIAGKRSPFVELTLDAPEAAARAGTVVYEIVLSRQRCLRLSSGFERDRVRQLLELLEESC
jgi:hypothetical protein